jgi:hypothetical protein
MTYISHTDFALEVAKGNIAKHSVELKFGRNSDIDTGANEDIWSSGGTFVEPTASRTHSVVSTSAFDSSASTGAQTVTIVGLDASYNIQTETVTMNGTTPVNTANTYTFINRMFVATFGSGGANIGTITATAAIDATVQATIEVGVGQTLKAIYMVPNGYKAYITAISASIQQTTANNSIDVMLYTKDFGSGGYRLRRNLHLTNSGTSTLQRNFDPYLQVDAKTIIKMRAENASANNNMVSGGFDMYIVQD